MFRNRNRDRDNLDPINKPLDQEGFPWGFFLVVWILIVALVLGNVTQAGGFGELRVSTQRVKLVLQQGVIDEQIVRLNVGGVVEYEYADDLPDLELYSTLRTYAPDGTSLGFEVQGFLREPHDTPGTLRFHYELSTLIGVTW